MYFKINSKLARYTLHCAIHTDTPDFLSQCSHLTAS